MSISSSFAQVGGRYSFGFLNVANNAHVSGIGGINVSLYDRDPNLFLQNPALIHDSISGYLSVNYLPYPGDIRSSSITYGFGKKAKWCMGFQYFGYGQMDETDEAGNVIGTFGAGDAAFSIGRSHTIGLFTMGASGKMVYSNIASYTALATLVDLGGVFRHPTHEWTIGLVLKNAGITWKTYTPDGKVYEPMDLQLGTSYKFEHLPVRLSLTAHHLQKWDIVYNDSTRMLDYNFDGTPIVESTSVFDKVTRHLVIGAEVLISKSFHFYFGYNFQRRGELRMETKSGGAGITIGGMLRISKFHFGYSHSYYHLAGGSNCLTVTMNTHSFMKKK